MQADPKQLAMLSSVHELVERDIFRPIYEGSDCRIIVFDAKSLRIISANATMCEILDKSLRDLRKSDLCDLLPAVEEGRLKRIAARMLNSSRSVFRLRVGAGSAGYSKIKLQLLGEDKTSIIAYVEPNDVLHSVSQKAAIAEERLSVAIEALSDGFVLYDKDDRLVICNEKYRDIYRESAKAMVEGATFEEILRYGLERNQYSLGFNTPEVWLQKRMEEHRACNSVTEQRLNDGRWLRIVERQTSDGGRVGLRVDITQQKEQQNELRKMARTDDLTGLLNRRGITRKLQILATGLLEGERLAIFNLDLEGFKSINEVYGHDAGDILLAEQARRLQDFRPQPDAIARMGADDFIIALHGRYSDEELTSISNRLLDLVSQSHTYEHQALQVGANIGVSYVTPEDSEQIEGHITAADIALKEAQRSGNSNSVIFTPHMREEVFANIRFAKDIRRGLEANEFLPFFQPQLDTATGRVVGFEALIRWRHPDKGMVPAFKFLDVAQRVGLTEALDDLVMDKSCEAVRTMQSWGLEPVCVSINLSLAQISDPKILRRLQTCLERHDVEPDNIRVELLESTLLDDRASIIVKNVHKLIRAGFQVELDDFGTGHAAIATLRKFEVSRIKVDRSLVSQIDSDPELQVITSALIDLAKNLGIDALAEGVETPDEQKKLWEMGCYVAQGYLHAHPMPLEAIHDWLVERGDIPTAPSQAASA